MLEFLILGPLEVRADGRSVPVPGFRQRALLAMLLLHANEVVASGRLLDELWGAEPRTDTAVLRVRISQLRKALRVAGCGELLQTRPPGYVLNLDRDWLDLGRHERLTAEAGLALEHDPARAAARLREALALWRGPPLADFAYEPFAQTAIGRLEELRLTTLETWIDAELASGRDREMVGELSALVAGHPLREGFRAQMMLALYRTGRQAEALEVYQQTRSLLVEELGIEPAPALQELHRAVLTHDPSLERRPPRAPAGISPTRAAPAPPAAARHEWRKTVTVLACDLGPASPGGRLDAEVMRGVTERCRQASSEIVARPGGTVEAFAGDVVMAVFGHLAVHEDDALRALRAAVEVRRALTLLSGELGGQWKVGLDHRPPWGGGKLNAASVTLEPLTGAESRALADWLIRDLGAAETTRARVVETARGNPLFTEQLVAMLADGQWDEDEPPLPGTIEALLAARLDLLGPAEQVTLEYAAALGDRFPAAPLAQLIPPDLRTTLPRHLAALVRKELLRPAHLLVGGGDGYRFRHILVREAAYRRLPKTVRADLDERYADWLESASDPEMSGGRAELLGFHLERAHAYRLQLGPGDPRGPLLAKRAAAHLSTAGAEAFARTDFRAVDQLLARAASLMASDDPRRPALLYDRGTSLFTLGRVGEADAVLVQALEAAQAIGDTRTQWRARIDRVFTQTEAGPAALSAADQARLAREALRALEPLGDERGLARAWLVAAWVEERHGRAAKKEQAAERTLRHARRSGIYREEAWGLWWLADAILTGPTPVAAGIARCEELLRGRGELRVGDVGVLGTLALFQAMQGHFERGRQMIAQGRELMESLGHTNPLVATMCWRGELELLAGNPGAAEAVLDEARRHAAASGSLATGANIAALLARTLLRQGRHAEAERLVDVARAGALPGSRPAQARWRSLLAAVHAARGQTGDAVALATHASRLLRPTDLLPLRADVLIDLASALAARGDTAKATRAAGHALALYTEKGNIVAAQRTRNTWSALSART